MQAFFRFFLPAVPVAPLAQDKIGRMPALAFHLRKYKCNRSNKSKFVAEENIRLFIQFTGENNIGVFLLILPDGLSTIKESQKKWE
jgi:hypothetical protein